MSTNTISQITYTNQLKEKLETKTAVIGVIGLGYVGLPNALHKAKQDYKVIGYDKDPKKVESINNGFSYIDDVESNELNHLVQNGFIEATQDPVHLSDVDVVLICVPTPIDEHKLPDLSFIQSAMTDIARHISTGTLVILESTTYPGTTEDYVVRTLEDHQFRVGVNAFVAYSPERIDPSNKTYNLNNTPRVIGGHTSDCSDLAKTFIGGQTHIVTSTKAAEMSKVFENTFRFVNIALANELALISDEMDIDVWEVIEASNTKPFGFMAFYPTTGVGGHCIPVDPYYLTFKAKEYSAHTKLIDTAGEINDHMYQYTVTKLMKILNDINVTMNNSRIAILGATYKKDISDVRESPIFNLLKELEEYDGQVDIFDPYVNQLTTSNKTYQVNDIDYEALSYYDVTVVLTNHTLFDINSIKRTSNVIFDTKNLIADKDQKGKYYKL